MTTHFKIPRGLSTKTYGAQMATGRWATEQEKLAYEFQPGDIYLGITRRAPKQALPVIAELEKFALTLASEKNINPTWRENTLLQTASHIETLQSLERVPIGINDDRNQITKAGTRGGKGISLIVPNLCLYPGSALVIDPKATNARLTALRRGNGSKHCEGMGQKTHILATKRFPGLPKDLMGAFNPLDLLDPEDEECLDLASTMAGALVVSSKEDDAHFDDTARSLIKGLMLYVILNVEAEKRNLPYVHTLLMRGARDQMIFDKGAPIDGDDPDPFQYLLELMLEEERLEGVIAGIAATLLDMGEREYGSVLSTARRNLEFLERPGMRRVLSKSTFSLDDLKNDPNGMTIYLCMPPTRMSDSDRWLRLMIACALESIYETTEAPKSGHPVLFLLEEFPTLKHMEIIENAAGFAAEYGLKLWIICQDLSQLKRHYKDGWETFLANSGVVQAFANSDMTTLEYQSKKLGQTEVVQTTRNTTTSMTASSNDVGDFQRTQSLLQSRGMASLLNPLSVIVDQENKGKSATSSTADTQQIHRSPLMLPDEIERYFRRENMREIVMIKGEYPFNLEREAYYETPEFYGLFEPDRPPYRTLKEARKLQTEAQEMGKLKISSALKAANQFLTANKELIATALQKSENTAKKRWI